jgi:lambda family phage portal protein
MPSFIDRIRGAARAFSAGTPPKSQRPLPNHGKRGFDAANWDRLTMDWASPLTTGDAEMRTRMRTLRGRARELERNEPYINRYLESLVNNTFDHHGITLQSKAGDLMRDKAGKPIFKIDDAAVRIIESAWKEWCKNPFVTGDMSLNEGGRLILRNTARDGDTLTKYIVDPNANEFGFALQLFEGDIIDDYKNTMVAGAEGEPQSQIRMGVEVNYYQKAVGYWLLKEYPGDQMWWNSEGYYSERHSVENFIHLFKRKRITQIRDVSWLVPIMRDLKMLDGFDEAAIVAARTGAAKMGFFVQKAADGNPYDGSKDAAGNLITDAEPGAMEQLPYGMEFQSFNPEYPHPFYAEFVKSRVRRIGAGVSMNYNTLANDLENVNYSSIRAGVLDDREGYKANQTWFINRWQQPVFAKWLEISLLNGSLKNPFSGAALPFSKLSKFKQAEFRPRRWPWVDPLKDVQADVLAINNRLTSRTKVISENTADNFEDIIRETANEDQFAEENDVEMPSVIADPGEVKTGLDQNPESADTPPEKKGKQANAPKT